MDKLGFLPDTLEKFKASLSKPYGLILVCGPTGSGKSTTLYAALNSINSPDTKILTAENPVEYNLAGIVQVNILQEIGFDFPSALRAFLRQDPDVIMIGEIRDKETAQIAMEAAMTGHLVFSTIHTNDAPSAVARLHEMGIPSFLIASSIECILAQRLLRRICPECKYKVNLTKEHVEFFEKYNIDLSAATVYKGRGCEMCNGTGYKGRAGIHELLVMTDEMRAILLKEIAAGPVRIQAKKDGMRTLLEDGLEKVVQGRTSLEEVLATAQ
jgi:type II secretory ATPase GspE/PulE/Tfp pilus assembly ATPase PilB-like protein